MFLKLIHESTLSIWTEEKSELRKQQYTVTLFDSNHLLAQVIRTVLWQMEKLMCYCTVFVLIYFEFEGSFQVQAPGGLYLVGRFNKGFFALRVWGANIWRDFIHEGDYFRNFTVCIRN